jgi:hypothetical protein
MMSPPRKLRTRRRLKIQERIQVKTVVKNGSVEVFTHDKGHAHEKIGRRKNVNE